MEKELKMNNKIFIGITGKALAGKDTLATRLRLYFAQKYQLDDIIIFPMAKCLKDFCIIFLGLTKEDLYTQTGKEKYIEDFKMTVREILQKVGTDALRNNFHEDIHIIMHKNMIKKENFKVCIIPDIRFENEYNYIKSFKNGFIIKVEGRGGSKIGYDHESESLSWHNKVNFDFIVDNSGNLQNLNEKAKKITNQILKKLK